MPVKKDLTRLKRGSIINGLYLLRYHSITGEPILLEKEDYDRRLKLSKQSCKKQYETKGKIEYQNNKDLLRPIKKELWRKTALENPLYHIMYITKRNCNHRKLSFEIDREFITDLLSKQDGRCYYTGVKMIVATKTKSPYQLSIDRLDSSFGYTKTNVVLCCQSMNFAKWDLSEKVFKDFLLNISQSIQDIKQLIK